jgi:hypothetical protein
LDSKLKEKEVKLEKKNLIFMLFDAQIWHKSEITLNGVADTLMQHGLTLRFSSLPAFIRWFFILVMYQSCYSLRARWLVLLIN